VQYGISKRFLATSHTAACGRGGARGNVRCHTRSITLFYRQQYLQAWRGREGRRTRHRGSTHRCYTASRREELLAHRWWRGLHRITRSARCSCAAGIEPAPTCHVADLCSASLLRVCIKAARTRCRIKRAMLPPHRVAHTLRTFVWRCCSSIALSRLSTAAAHGFLARAHRLSRCLAHHTHGAHAQRLYPTRMACAHAMPLPRDDALCRAEL